MSECHRPGGLLDGGMGKRGNDIPAVQARRAHGWHLEDLKRDAYAKLLRSVSSSYAQAYADEEDSEDASILRAVTLIELLADANIADAARQLQIQVNRAHGILRSQGYKAARGDRQGRS
jgi:hypothetical protein